MRKAMILLFALLVGLPTLTHAQSAKDALRALKRIEAHFQTGISYVDLTRAVGDAKFEVNLFQESKEASRNISLTDLINKIMSEYEDAKDVYKVTLGGPYRKLDYISPPIAQLKQETREKLLKEYKEEQQYWNQMVDKYPDSKKKIEDGGSLTVDESDIGKENPKYGRVLDTKYLLPIILRYASNDLKEAMKLLSKETE